MSMHENSRMLISDTLQGNLADVDISEFKNLFIIAILFVKVGNSIESIVGTTVSYSMEKDYELDITVLLQDAYALSDAWPNINLEKFELHLGQEIITIPGPLRVAKLGVKNIEPERRTCVLAMKLCTE